MIAVVIEVRFQPGTFQLARSSKPDPERYPSLLNSSGLKNVVNLFWYLHCNNQGHTSYSKSYLDLNTVTSLLFCVLQGLEASEVSWSS